MAHKSKHQSRPSLLRRFNQRTAKIFPGWKTKATAALGSLGTLAALLQGYMSGLPLDKLPINPLHLLAANVLLFSLAFWFKDLSKYNVNDNA